MKPETLSLRQLNRMTLARQMLLERADISVARVVERLAGMQAQEPKPPFIGLWSRLNGFQRSDLHTVIHRRELVRATLMRGTLHLVTAADYRAFRAVVEPQLAQALRNIGDRSGELDIDAALARARQILAERPHTFTEIRGRLTEAFPHIHDRALGITVRLLLPLVMYPTDARWGFPADATFTLAADWMGGAAHDPTGEPALLIRRYLASFGPATVADFQEWSGVRGAKAWFEGLRPELTIFRDEKNRELFDLHNAPQPAQGIVAPPRFLPEFDNLLLAYADRRRVIDDLRRKDLVTKNGRVRATFLCDGRVCGFWRTERRGATATLYLQPFENLSDDAHDALTEEGKALLRFTEDDAEVFNLIWQEASP